MFRIFSWCALFFSIYPFSVPLAAQTTQIQQPPNRCVPHDVAVEQLNSVFNEKMIGIGLSQNQQFVMELYVGKSGSWTMLATLTNGMSCITASGQNWSGEELAPNPEAPQ